MLHDPALLIRLDGKRNQKGPPNESLDREFLGLFTMGAGALCAPGVAAVGRPPSA